MEKFIGTTVIKADTKPKTWAEHYAEQGWKWPEKKDGADRIGYTVGDPDVNGDFNGDKKDGCDYIYWSPVDVFEASYRPVTDMTFGLAIEAMRAGYKVKLPYWSDDVFLSAQQPDENSKMTHPYIYVTSRYGLVPWVATQVEMWSDKWMVVDG